MTKSDQEQISEQTQPQGSKQQETALSLGKMNRHWYRRCLDDLNAMLEDIYNPSLEDVQKVCTDIIQNFLKATTGQAPDSSDLQFPADRAYFFPFADDLVGEFQYAKPMYRISWQKNQESSRERDDNNPLSMNQLWSFFPWDIQTKEGEERRSFLIDRKRSINTDGQTISFKQMMASKARFREEADQVEENTDFLVSKSLILSDKKEANLLSTVMKRGTLGGEPFKDTIDADIREALVAIFEVYRELPGDPLAESILMVHIQLIMWLRAQISDDLQTNMLQEEGYRTIFHEFLKAFFIDKENLERYAYDDSENKDKKRYLNLNDLIDKKAEYDDLTNDDIESNQDDEKKEAEQETSETSKPYRYSFQVVMSQKQSPFKKLCQKNGKTPSKFLSEIQPDLQSFERYFLKTDVEERLAQDILNVLGDQALITGDTEESFVWVTPDFADFSDNYYSKILKTGVIDQTIVDTIVSPYKRFFRCLEATQLKASSLKPLETYWRTLGGALRDAYIFASFEDSQAKIARPKLADAYLELGGRPQNIFLRVNVRDTSNEPVINGLFVFTKDYDEQKNQTKKQDIRREDIQDLLSFAKVYFFIARDFFQSLDRAREAQDIGRLNQNLYDQRLDRLDQVMEQRVETTAFKEEGFSATHNRDHFLYEVINHYADSLIEKPRDLKGETFPFDRLLLIPLSGGVGSSRPFALPFFLFQSLFHEVSKKKVNGRHYSLIKPFQSPVDKSGKIVFQKKSFQEVSLTDDGEQEQGTYLSKVFLGSAYLNQQGNLLEKPKNDGGAMDTESLVVKMSTPQDFKFYGSSQCADTGLAWSRNAMQRFWELNPYSANPESRKERRMNQKWLDFLESMTLYFSTYADHDVSDHADTIKTDFMKGGPQWLLLRFALARILFEPFLSSQRLKDQNFEALKAAYQQMLRLKFEDRQELNLIDQIQQSFQSDFNDQSLINQLSIDQTKFNFISYDVRGPGIVLDFFRFLTKLVTNQPLDKDSDQYGQTYYQQLLIRPLGLAQGESEVVDSNISAGKRIGDRIPQYEAIEGERDALSSFIGLTSIAFGEDQSTKTQHTYALMMVRDYDDRTSSLDNINKRMESQLETDLRDFQLFTRTFFRNINKFVRDATRREKVQTLSNDVTQIARNWYSDGMDDISHALRDKLEFLIQTDKQLNLDQLRPEIVDTLFDKVFDVITAEQHRTDRRLLKLESFPFDRLLHLPLNLNLKQGSRLCYARTMIAPTRNVEKGSDTAEESVRWDLDDHQAIYAQIRKHGRRWDSLGGDKVVARRSDGEAIRYHLSPQLKGEHRALLQRIAKNKEIPTQLHWLVELNLLDEFVRRLYEVREIPRLSICGLILFLLELWRKHYKPTEGITFSTSYNDAIDQIKLRLNKVMQDSISECERDYADSKHKTFTRVHMDQAIHLDEISLEGMIQDCLQENEQGILPSTIKKSLTQSFGDATHFPILRHVFKALESGSGNNRNYRYGLGEPKDEISTKIFYVYYAIEAPNSFFEQQGFGGVYRGMFAFVLDDYTTASIDEDMEIADQQDIRTFIHNAVRYLKQTLNEQELQDQVSKPGLDDVIVGILHRIKNELAVPIAVFQELQDDFNSLLSLENAEEVPKSSVFKEIRERLEIEEEAKEPKDSRSLKVSKASMILRQFTEMFKKLKQLKDMKGDTPPLRTYTSMWLGWTFVEVVAASLMREFQAADGAEDTGLEDAIQEVKDVKERAEAHRDDAYDENAQDLVQRELNRLREALLTFAKTQNYTDFDPILSFQIFSHQNLSFLASILIEEAFKVLVENSFQAFWSYLRAQFEPGGFHHKKSKEGCKLKLVCDNDDQDPDLLRVDLLNSTETVDEGTVKILTHESPQVLTSKEHKRHSGKEGGSGFGHYFARRIIKDYCGGEQFKKKLDVDFQYAGTAATISCKLLLSKTNNEQKVESIDLIKQAARYTKIKKTPEIEACTVLLPEFIRADQLMKVTAELLEEQINWLEETIIKSVNNAFVVPIGDQIDELREQLLESLQAKAEPASQDMDLEGMIISLRPDNQRRIPLRSYQKLGACIAEIAEAPELFQHLMETLPDLERLVTSSGEIKTFDHAAFSLPGGKKLANRLAKYLPYFTEEPQDSLAYFKGFITLDQQGRPCVDEDRVRAPFKDYQWRIHNSVDTEEERYYLRLSLAKPGAKIEALSPKHKMDRRHYERVKMGSILLDYQDAIRRVAKFSGELKYEEHVNHQSIHIYLPILNQD